MNIKYIRENITNSATVWGPPEFTGWKDEQMSWKENCYIGDWSWLSEVRVKGSDAEKFYSRLSGEYFCQLRYRTGEARHYVQRWR